MWTHVEVIKIRYPEGENYYSKTKIVLEAFEIRLGVKFGNSWNLWATPLVPEKKDRVQSLNSKE